MWTYCEIQTPVGEMFLAGELGVLNKIYLPGQKPTLIDSHWERDPKAYRHATDQLKEYFAGRRREFSVDFELKLSPFQQKVLKEVAKIPYGDTLSYQEVANRLGNPKAVRAVGTSNGKNPLPIIIPCHRVIGSSQKLVGYAGGLKLKKYLLELESKQLGLF